MDIYNFLDVLDSIYEYNITSPYKIANELGISTIKLTNILNIFLQNGIIAITGYDEIITLISYDKAVDIINSLK